MRDELTKALMPLLQGLERNQKTMADAISEAISDSIVSANNKLSSQIENSLQRQVRNPIEALSSQLLQRPAQPGVDPKQELARKIVRAQQEQQQVSGTDKRPEAA